MNIGTSLRKLLDNKGLTTRFIANKIGVSLSTYVDWENDKTAPSLRLYRRLANAFEVTPLELMSYFVDENSPLLCNEEKLSIAELRETVLHLQKVNYTLLARNERFVSELEQIKELIKRNVNFKV